MSDESNDLGESWVSCKCNTCSGQIEFDSSLVQSGTTIPCPHCGIDTLLYIPKVRGNPAPPLDSPRTDEERADQHLRPHDQAPLIIVTTGNEIGGRSIETYLGIARGVVVRSPDIIQGVFGGLKQIVGGNIETYARVCEDTRRQAFSRMVDQAANLEADAIIAMRYDATEFAPGITEVLAYGTAVKLSKSSSITTLSTSTTAQDFRVAPSSLPHEKSFYHRPKTE